MYKDLTKEHCVPDDENRGHLMAEEVKELLPQIPKWKWEDHERLERKFKFKNFTEALEFVNNVGELAEREGHHPDIKFGWGYVKIMLSTHSVDGVTENDFILAAKVDELFDKDE